MDRKASRALLTFRACVSAGRYFVLTYFVQRMDRRGLVWPDVLAVLDSPQTVRAGGTDRYGRDKWLVGGTAADGEAIEFVCALDVDQRGKVCHGAPKPSHSEAPENQPP
jgi:hypothetical protein